MTDEEYDEELRRKGRAAVEAALLLMPVLEQSAVGFKLDESRICIGLELPQWVYELSDAGKWSATMTNLSSGQKWSISAVWVLSVEEQALIKQVPSAPGTGRTNDYVGCSREACDSNQQSQSRCKPETPL